MDNRASSATPDDAPEGSVPWLTVERARAVLRPPGGRLDAVGPVAKADPDVKGAD